MKTDPNDPVEITKGALGELLVVSLARDLLTMFDGMFQR